MQNFFTQKKSINEFSTDKSRLNAVQILLWAKGICIVGHDDNDDVINATTYSFDEVYPLKNIEQVILNEPMLADPYLIKNVWLSVSRNLMVPQLITDRDRVDELFHQYYYREVDETMTVAHDHTWGIDIYFPKKQLIKDILQQYFPNRKQHFLIAPKSFLAFTNGNDSYTAFAIIIEKSCSLTITRGNKLIHNYILDLDDPKELLLRCGEIIETEQDLLNTQFFLTGIHTDINHWVEELRSYGYSINVNNEFTLLNALKLLSRCE